MTHAILSRLGICALVAGMLTTLGLLHASAPLSQKPPATAAENYKTKCAGCHMADGAHPFAEMSFADGTWDHGSSLKEIQKVISKGIAGTAMKPFEDQFSEAEIKELAKYVRAFDKKLMPEKAPASPSKG
jgi:mono/diheme cytochrome c family protein